MSERYPGGFIQQTAPTLNPALGNAAPGIWTMDQVIQAIKAGTWPAYDPYWEYVTLMLHGNGTNGAQNNTFLDSSTNNFTITRNGNTTQGTFSPYGSNWSNYFDGSGDYLEIANSTNLDFGSGDFTVECFVNFNSVSTQQAFFSKWRVGPGYEYFFGYDPANGLNFVYSTTGSGAGNVGRTYAVTLSVGVWYHVAFCRSSGSTRAFVNGYQVGSTTSDNVAIVTTNQIQTVGIIRDDALFWPMNGYISNLRVLKGTALYTSNFNTSIIPLTAVTNTQLLTCQSNRFVDNSTNNFTLTRNGDVSVQRFSPFNPTAPYAAVTDGGSGYFDGSGDYLTAPSNAAFAFGTGDFTIEAWIYCTNFSGVENFIFDSRSSVSTAGMGFNIEPTTGKLRYSGNANNVLTSTSITANTWTHVAWVRSGSTLTGYINGVSGGSVSNSDNLTQNVGAIGVVGFSASGYFNGYISNLRVVKGTAVYTTNFTPSTTPLTPITNTSLLLNFTNAGIIDNAEMNNLETVGNAQISTAQSKFGGASMLFDGSGDGVQFRSFPQPLSFGTGDFTIEFWVYPATSPNNNWTPILTMGFSGGGQEVRLSQNINNTGWGWLYPNNSNNADVYAGFGTLTTSTWSHIAMTRSGSTLRLFKDGVLISTATSISFNFTNRSLFSIGLPQAAYSDGAFNGYVDDVRITTGYARYTAAFTPPTSQLQDQ
jgi:hypothetical protein